MNNTLDHSNTITLLKTIKSVESIITANGSVNPISVTLAQNNAELGSKVYTDGVLQHYSTKSIRPSRDVSEFYHSMDRLTEYIGKGVREQGVPYQLEDELVSIHVQKINFTQDKYFHQTNLIFNLSSNNANDTNSVILSSTILKPSPSVALVETLGGIPYPQIVGITLLLSIIPTEQALDSVANDRIQLAVIIPIGFNLSEYRNIIVECVTLPEDEDYWNTSGVTTHILTDDTVMCGLSHFSSFAVLVRPFSVSSNESSTIVSSTQLIAISIISYVLLSLSFLFLLASLFAYILAAKEFFKFDTNVAYFNLALALLFAIGSFLFGIQSAKNNYVGCYVVTILIHYSWLAAFSWNLCVGFLILYKLYFVLHSSTHRIHWFLIVFGWCSPLFVVIPSVGIAHDYYIQLRSDYCWLGTQRGLFWSFIAPILLVLCLNFVFLIFGIVKIVKTQSADNSVILRMKKGLTAICVLTPVLGLSWSSLLLVQVESLYDIALEWIFVLLNGPIGILFFFLFVIRNNEVTIFFKGGKRKQLLKKYSKSLDEGSTSSGLRSYRYSLKSASIDTQQEHSTLTKTKPGNDDDRTTSPRTSICE